MSPQQALVRRWNPPPGWPPHPPQDLATVPPWYPPAPPDWQFWVTEVVAPGREPVTQIRKTLPLDSWFIVAGAALLASSPFLPWLHVILYGDLNLFQIQSLQNESSLLPWVLVLLGIGYVPLTLALPRALLVRVLNITALPVGLYGLLWAGALSTEVGKESAVASTGLGPVAGTLGALTIGCAAIVGLVAQLRADTGTRTPAAPAQRPSWPEVHLSVKRRQANPVPSRPAGAGEGSELASISKPLAVGAVPTGVAQGNRSRHRITAHLRWVALAGIVTLLALFGVRSLAARSETPASAAPHQNTAVPRAIPTVGAPATGVSVRLKVNGCDGCTLVATNTSTGYSKTWVLSGQTISTIIPRASTRGLGFAILAPDQGGNAQSVVVLGFPHLPPGMAVTGGLGHQRAQTCWAGTTDSSYAINIYATKFFDPQFDGSPGHSVAAVAKPTLATMGYVSDLDSHGAAGTQDAPCTT